MGKRAFSSGLEKFSRDFFSPLALLVSDWAFGGGKRGGKFRWCFYWTVFASRRFSSYPTNRGCFILVECPPSLHPGPLLGPQSSFRDGPGGEEDVGGSKETVSEQGAGPQDFWSSPQMEECPLLKWSLSGKASPGSEAEWRPWLSEG